MITKNLEIRYEEHEGSMEDLLKGKVDQCSFFKEVPSSSKSRNYISKNGTEEKAKNRNFGGKTLYNKEEYESSTVIQVGKDMSLILSDFPKFESNMINKNHHKENDFLVKYEGHVYNVSEDIYTGIEKGYEGSWVKTDDFQILKQVGENTFGVINILKDRASFVLGYELIQLEEISEETMASESQSYYDSLDTIKNSYHDAWKQIVAEIISENNFIHIEKTIFDSIEKVNEYLKENNIEVTI